MEWTPAAIRALRAVLRLSQDGFARLIEVDAKTVRNWETSRHDPQPASRRALDRAEESLSAAQRERFRTVEPRPEPAASRETSSPLSVMLAATGHPPITATEDEVNVVHRREFLERGIAAGAALAIPQAVAALSEQLAGAATSPRYIDRGLIVGLRELVPELSRRYYDTPPAQLFGLVAPSLSGVNKVLGSRESGDRDHRELCSLAGELAGLAGWLGRDLGQPASALTWLNAGLRLAKRAGDQELRSYLLEALTVHFADMPEVTLSLVQRANAVVTKHGSPTLRAFLAAREAEELAAFGDARGFGRAITRAERATEKIIEDDRSRWVHYWGPARLLSYQGVGYLRLGRLPEAEATLSAVLPALPPALVKGRGLVLADLASVHAARGDIHQACDLAQQALDAVAEVKTPTTVQRVLKLRAELEPFAARSEVRDLDERLRVA